MSTTPNDLGSLPDLAAGVPATLVPVGRSLVGRVADDAVLVLRTRVGLRAVQATCPHYGAPLAEGCVEEGRIHCPWHHASFDLDDGALIRPPALTGLRTWSVEERDGRVVVGGEITGGIPVPAPPRTRGTVVVVGAGAAGTAAVLTLREAGHGGPILLIDPDADAPYDRPNLSKDYLAGTAPEDWLPLRTARDWDALDVQRVVNGVSALHPEDATLALRGGGSVAFDGLVLATGAEPRRLDVPGAGSEHVVTLRSLDDCRRLRERARPGTRAVVVGAGFIGLEAAASLRAREVEVSVVAPDPVPLANVLGTDLGAALQALHERHGVRFHLGTSVASITASGVRLDDGTTMDADLVVVGIGVRPKLELARQAGLDIDGGVVVDSFLESSREGIYAAGDIARFPHPLGGPALRIEHWAVAEGQGRTAALNLLGHRQPYRDVPFFWTSHFGVTIQWSGFPDPWDEAEAEGGLEEGRLVARFLHEGRARAAAFVGREEEALQWELAMARTIADGVG